MTNINTERRLMKGDIVRCVNAYFGSDQKVMTPYHPLYNRLYIIRDSLPNLYAANGVTYVVLLEEVRNSVYKTLHNNRIHNAENGFDPIRFELLIPADETDWAVNLALSPEVQQGK